jgi:tryptophan-rich sensory protein
MSWITLAGFLAATLGAGATGVLFPPGAWYRTLRKPAWTPPDRLFPIAWTALYLAMAFAAWRVALSPSPWAAPGLALWSWQIVMNALWSPVFFGLRRPGAALVVLAALWTAVVLTTVLFRAADPVAGLLMTPYVLWVSYAGALNFWIWRANPEPRPAAPAAGLS